MSGMDLAEAVHRARPAVPVLFMSGYAAARLLPSDVEVLSKPFDVTELATKVRTAIETAERR
jgi:DNA-binding NtrC family response regulator